ncbi:MAG: hypothetical protein NXH85_13575 [Pseudomonadaceae bacterium]|nr:hypothetical protein [Pseudomonadaceae bacterium]
MFELINERGQIEDGAHDFGVLWASVTEAWRQLDLDDGRYSLNWGDEGLFEVVADGRQPVTEAPSETLLSASGGA